MLPMAQSMEIQHLPKPLKTVRAEPTVAKLVKPDKKSPFGGVFLEGPRGSVELIRPSFGARALKVLNRGVSMGDDPTVRLEKWKEFSALPDSPTAFVAQEVSVLPRRPVEKSAVLTATMREKERRETLPDKPLIVPPDVWEGTAVKSGWVKSVSGMNAVAKASGWQKNSGPDGVKPENTKFETADRKGVPSAFFLRERTSRDQVIGPVESAKQAGNATGDTAKYTTQPAPSFPTVAVVRPVEGTGAHATVKKQMLETAAPAGGAKQSLVVAKSVAGKEVVVKEGVAKEGAKPAAARAQKMVKTRNVLSKDTKKIISSKEGRAGGLENSKDSGLEVDPSVSRLDIRGLGKVGPLSNGTAPGPSSVSLANSVAVQIAQSTKGSVDRLVEISLDPVELGKVRLMLHRTETGMQVQIIADRLDTIDLMRRNTASLTAEFQDIGYRDVGFSFSQSGQGQPGNAPVPEPREYSDGGERTLHQQWPTPDMPEYRVQVAGLDVRF